MQRTLKSKKRHLEHFVVSLFFFLTFAPIFVVGATHLDDPATKLFNNTRTLAEQTIKRIRSDSVSLFQGAPLQKSPSQFATVALSGSSDGKDGDFSYSSSASVFINKAIAFTRKFFASIFGQQNQTKLVTAPTTIVQPVQNVPLVPDSVPDSVPAPVRERVIERTIVLSAPPALSSISEGFLAEQLGKIESVLRAEISRVETNTTRQSDNNSSTISAVNRMNAISSMYPSNTLVGQTITNSSFSGTTFTGTTGSFSGGVSAASLSVTGDTTFDINTLFVDSLNNRVGIGTATPSDTLSVNGTLYLSQASAPASTTDRLYNTSGSLFWAGNIIGGATTGNWVTDGTNAWRATGNVGIGTTTPDSKLTVIGDGYFDGNITASSLTATGTANITGLTTTGNLWVTGSSTLTNFTAGNSTTTNATSTNAFATNLSATNGVFTNATTINATSTNFFATNLSATNSTLSNATSTNFFSDVGRLTTGIIDTLTGTTATITELNITNSTTTNATSTNAFTTNLSATNSSLTNATSTNSFSTTASSTNLFTSNFSLGSISGFLKATAGAVTNALVNLTTDITGILGVGNGGTGASTITGLLQGNGTGAVTGIAGTAGQFPYYSGTNTLAATSTLFLSTDGNVGIGTTEPGYPLVVQTSGTGTTVNSNIIARLQANGTGYASTLQFSDGVTYASSLSMINGDFNFLVPGFGIVPSMVIKATSGNVGIGTTNPVTQLQVGTLNGAVVSDGQLTLAKSGGDGSVRAFRIGLDSTYALSIGDSGGGGGTYSPQMTLKYDTGNVGIGTTGPGSLLHLYAPTTSSVDFVKFSSADGGDIRVGKQLGFSNDAIFGVWSNNDVSFYANSAVAMTIKSAGNVGIGETAPGSKLSVSGGGSFGSGYDTTAAPTGGLIIEGNVGIGTTTPAYKLTVNGAAQIMAGESLNFQNVAGNGNSVIANTGAGTNKELRFDTGVSGALFIQNSGNVGIGTTNPQNTLHVNAGAGGGITLESNNGVNIDFRFREAGVNKYNFGYVAATEDLGIYDNTASAYRLYVKNDGNVGIGTTNPTAKLDVTGQTIVGAATSPGTPLNQLSFHNLGTNYAHFYDPGLTATNGGIAIGGATTVGVAPSSPTMFWNVNTGNVGIGTTTPNSKLAVVGSTNSSLGSFSDGSNGIFLQTLAGLAGIIGYNQPAAAYNNLELRAGGETQLYLKTDGNVGIGTTNPQAKLQVASTSLSYSPTALSYATRGTIHLGDDTTSSANDYTGISFEVGQTLRDTAMIALVDTGGESAISGGLAFLTRGSGNFLSERVRIDQDGNVGIGTTSPQYKLDLQTAGAFGATDYDISWLGRTGASEAGLVIGYQGDGSKALYPRIRAGGSGVTGLALGGGSASKDSVFIKNDGNVGIGTTTPDSKLTVIGNGYFDGNIYAGFGQQATTSIFKSFSTSHDAGNVPSELRIGMSDGSFAGVKIVDTRDGSLNSQSLFFDTHHGGISAGTRMVIDKDGNVGIGTVSPATKLHVAGDGAIMRLSSGDYIVGQIESRGTGVNYDKGLLRLFDTGTAKVNLDTAGDSYFNGGNVGIGTTNPNGRLHVADTGTTIPTSGYGTGLNVARADGLMGLAIGDLNSGAASYLQAKNFTNTDTMSLLLNPNGGNVGIGATTPNELLVVNGLTGTTPGIKISDAGQIVARLGDAGSGANIGLMQLYDNSGVEDVRLYAGTDSWFKTGSVGIGTTTPNSKLAVVGSTNSSLGSFSDGSNGIFLQTLAGLAGIIGYNQPAAAYNNLELRAGGETQLYLKTDGNVGIGTTTPGYLLHTYGSNGSAAVQSTVNGGNANLYFVAKQSNGTAQTWGVGPNQALTNADFEIYNNTTGSNVFTIQKTGNVGIGTTTPAQKLHVSQTATGVVARFTNGTGYCDINPTTTALVCTSDATLKKDVFTFGNALDTVNALRGVNFKWLLEEGSVTSHIGFIAQEVEQVVPELVTTDELSGKKAVNYIGFVPILVEAVKELAKRVEAIIAKVAGFAEVFTTKKLCVGNTCVNETQLRALLIGAGTFGTSSPSPSAGLPTDTTPTTTTETAPADTTTPADTQASTTAEATEPTATTTTETAPADTTGDTNADTGDTTTTDDTSTTDSGATDTSGDTTTTTETTPADPTTPADTQASTTTE